MSNKSRRGCNALTSIVNRSSRFLTNWSRANVPVSNSRPIFPARQSDSARLRIIGMQTNRRRRGFSLIELLIVIAIILILAMIAVPKVNQQLMSARETAAIQEIKTIHQAETQYYSTFSRYATSL